MCTHSWLLGARGRVHTPILKLSTLSAGSSFLSQREIVVYQYLERCCAFERVHVEYNHALKDSSVYGSSEPSDTKFHREDTRADVPSRLRLANVRHVPGYTNGGLDAAEGIHDC
jgi:hypothetical protein|eukprot:COSAG02_NODE_14782_length_1236_cov_30.824719_1_plen_114_part_00